MFKKKKNQISNFVYEIVRGFREIPVEKDVCDECKWCRERAEKNAQQVRTVFKRFL